MLKRLLITFLFFTSIQTVLANTTPVLVITPSGYETPLNKSGSSVTVITASEIEDSGFTTVSEILNTVPGINSVQNGFGGTASLYARGHESDMTKIMLDGIDLYDPSGIGTTRVLATLMLHNIEQIEIVLGPQSLIAGADAMGGVINIITKKDTNISEVSAYSGSNSTSNASSNLGFVQNGFQVNLNLNEFKTKGTNVATGGDDDLDGFDQSSVSLSLNKNFSEFNFDFSFLSEKGKVEYDDAYNPLDPYVYNDNTFFKSGIDIDLNPKATLRLEYNNSDFDSRYYSTYGSNYFASTETLKLNSKYVFNQNNIAFIGVETKTEEYVGTGSVSDISYFAQNEFKVNVNTTLLAGFRIDDNDQFGSHGTYRFTANHISQQIPGLIFKASVGSGFRAPGLYELYNPTYGNANLTPETSFGYDLGFINYLSSNVTFGSTYFKSELEDLIGGDAPTYVYYNKNGMSERDGIETFINFYPNDNSEIKVSHTHLRMNERNNIRRPNNAVTVSGNYRLNNQLKVSGNLNAVEEHYGAFGGIISSYEVINLGMDYAVDSNMSLNLKFKNVTDENYEPILGYPGLPRQAFLGFKYKF
jgi:vitamin B12 transporter